MNYYLEKRMMTDMLSPSMTGERKVEQFQHLPTCPPWTLSASTCWERAGRRGMLISGRSGTGSSRSQQVSHGLKLKQENKYLENHRLAFHNYFDFTVLSRLNVNKKLKYDKKRIKVRHLLY